MGARRARYPSHVQLAIDQAVALQDTRPRAERIELILPFPPTVNHAYRPFKDASGRARIGMTGEARRYKKAAAETIGAWLAAHGCRPPAPPYRLAIRAIPGDRRKHDLDNLTKIVCDAVFGAIDGDDDDVTELHVVKEPSDAWPRIVVTLEGAVS